MDRFREVESFVSVAARGSLSAAARAEGVTPALIGRRIDALERRLGVKLLLRTTRRVSLTFEGSAFLEDCQRILVEMANAEASVSMGGKKASGHVRITAPAGFGRKHVAPLIMKFLNEHPDVSVELDLSDRLVDLVNESIDCGVRIGDLRDSSLVSLRLGHMRRVVVASPSYVTQHGQPTTPDDLARHSCLVLVQQRGWSFVRDGQTEIVKVSGALRCNDGAVLHEWALAGQGLAWRSLWEVGADLAAGRLVSLLDEYAAPPIGIHAIFPIGRRLPMRVRLLVEAMKGQFSDNVYWSA